jgi:hypothetical protein
MIPIPWFQQLFFILRLSSQPSKLGIESQPLNDGEAPLRAFFQSWRSDVQSRFLWTKAKKTVICSLKIEREKEWY